MSKQIALCEERQSACVCEEPAGHKGPHICACGGSWIWDMDGEFRIFALPNANTLFASKFEAPE